jgi:hypothetical protein
MTQLEYLVALISIIVGLGLTELAQSVRELIRPGHPVRWDGLPLAWSAFVFLFTILLWWNGFSVLSQREEAGPIFLTYLLIFFLLYLCCAFVLPDPDWEGTGSSQHRVDLEAFYFSAEHRRWFFGLLIGLLVVLVVVNQVAFQWENLAERLESTLALVGLGALLAVPIWTERRWAHWTVVAVVTGFFVWRATRVIVL